MEYFTVSYPAGARLSMSVVGREDAALPRLGNTVVDGVEAPGYSHDGGVQRGDFIVSVNDQYVAFTGNAEVVRLLQSIMKDQKELSIRFARPKESEWKRINGSSEHPIREGSINKLHQGLFKKWNSRHFKVTRETFSSSVDSVLKNKFDVDGDIGRPRLATGYPLHQGVFELRCGEKDVILQTNSTEQRDLWMHAIECAIEKTFFQPLPSQHTSRNGQAYVPNSRPPLPPPTEQSTDGMEAYLRMGREAILSNQNASNGGGPRQVRASSHGDGSSAAETGVYKILSLSSVQAIGGPDTIISLAPNFTNPADLAPALVDYDFSLEMKALEKRDMYEDAH
ncbi:Hypothetical Protein FCC1311_031342 [Hondaea fermentalgiana]|uniref:PH domain-containing protein n=1 Tax=Hondaea fermentalgiana TaxID=2315210 RepID=A0A2R5GF93_9STRA|nr:Hypothetical Protein FCC1311_031342 [Hondaea fermentalgiana]|eukprot:GBG26911.1 Hypothetical Protein FCC1311_031342 [Hondaea fermentalgiana]